MLAGRGYWKGGSALISGTAGTGKTSFAAAFADASAGPDGRCLYFSFEEAPDQIVRNMASIGFRLGRHVRTGRLRFHSVRPTLYGLESHLVNVHGLVRDFRPDVVIMDPDHGNEQYRRSRRDQGHADAAHRFPEEPGHHRPLHEPHLRRGPAERSDVGVSSLMDTWIILQMVESAGERKRVLFVLKSRGMAHSHQMREFAAERPGHPISWISSRNGAVRLAGRRRD